MNFINYLFPKLKVSIRLGLLSMFRRIVAGLYNKSHIFKPIFKKVDALYHNQIIRYIKKIDQKSNFTYIPNKKKKISNGCIFYFWWDGLESLPHICKKCYESVCRNKGHQEVIFLDKNNYLDYIDLPEIIKKRFDEKSISLTLLSDVIRLCLLSTYDCVWVDSTIYFVDQIPEKLFKQRFVSCKSPTIVKDINNATAIVNKNYPVYFFISKDGYIFNDVLNVLVKYWEINNSQLEYFFTNYAFDYIIESDKRMLEYSNSREEVCPRVEWLLPHISSDYNFEEFSSIKKNTFLFKLNWKISFDNISSNSYYMKIMNEVLK